MSMYKDRVVVVTGAAGGMGALIVQRFLSNGDTVIGTDTTMEAMKNLETSVGKGTKLLTLATDIADPVSCGKLADFARDKVEKVDILVNCAGFFPTKSFADMTLEDWNKVIGINLTGVFLMCKAI